MNFLDRFSKYFKKTHPPGAQLFHAEGHDRAKIRFCNSANTQKVVERKCHTMKIYFKQFKEELYDACGTDRRMILK